MGPVADRLTMHELDKLTDRALADTADRLTIHALSNLLDRVFP